MLLRNSIPYGTFAELAKWLYVDVASSEFYIPGRKQTTSRAATITGLTRKEVKRLKEISGPDDLGAAERYNRAARVISGWLKDSLFTNAKGDPLELLFESGDNSFSSLVKSYSGDVPPRAILDEMTRVGAVEVIDGKVRLLTRGYIVKEGEAEMIGIMGVDVSEFIATFDHNMTHDQSEAFLQRKISYDNIPEEALPELRDLIFVQGRDFSEAIDRLIAKYDRDTNPSLKGSGKKKAGLGIFYFE
jgi:hypothetical protein